MKLVQELRAADALQLKRSPLATSLIDRIGIMPAAYLAHEYMNDSFAPCFHADVAQAFADAKLEWAGSASLVENFPELALTPEQRAVTQRLDDPLVRELMKDMCLERSLRHDVFVRGARHVNPAARDAALMDVWLALNISPEEMPVRGRDAGRPCRAEPQLLRADHRGDGNGAAPRGRPARRARPGGPARQPGRADRHPGGPRSGGVGGAAGRRTDAAGAALQSRNPGQPASHRKPGRAIAAASHALGTGAPCTLFDLYMIERTQAGDSEARIDDWVRDIGVGLDDEGRGKLREVFAKALRVRLPILRAQGVYWRSPLQ